MKSIKSIATSSYTVDYHPYDANLPAVFNEVKRLIQQALPDVRVEHVGSSSISGVGGRNAIDIVIPAVASDQAAIKSHLATLGFQDSPWQHFLPLLVGAVVFQAKEYTILLYVLPPDSDVYTGWITFRDYMRTHPEDARAYDLMKQQTIADGKVQRGQYQQAKTPFLVSMMAKIQRSAE